MAVPRTPAGLGARGRRLWRDLREHAEFDPAQVVLAEEACRITDRLDQLDKLLRGDSGFACLEVGDGGTVTLVVNSALAEARQQANVLKQIAAALRLPDEATGKRPQRRGPRGAYQPRTGVSSLERARAAREA